MFSKASAHDLYMSQEKLLELFQGRRSCGGFGRQMAEMQQVQESISTLSIIRIRVGNTWVLMSWQKEWTGLPTQPCPRAT